MTLAVDYSGKKFNHLTMIAYIKPGGSGRGAIWMAQCDCGAPKEVLAKYVVGGRVKSCGKCVYTRKLRHVPKGFKTTLQRKNYVKQIHRALRDGQKWEITAEHYKDLVSKECMVCGREPKARDHLVETPTRTHPYTNETVITICRRCRELKGRDNLVALLDLLVKIHDRGCLVSIRRSREISNTRDISPTPSIVS